MAALELINTTLINDSNLIHYYQQESSSVDYKGTSNGTDFGVAYSSTAGKFNNGADFTAGGTTRTTATVSSGLSGSFTILFWANLQSGLWNFAWYSHVASYNNYWACLGDNGANKLRWQMYDGTNNPFMDSASTISTPGWHLIGCVRDTSAGQLKLYIDGAADGTPVTDTTTSTPTYSNFIIGNVNAANDNFVGYMDDFAIFSRALSATEMANHFSGADAPVSSGISKLALLGVG